MRYLNKVVFINSASISYAEVMVDGNVHFIGTQGVGKSTLLRSILFFYNADTLKLGISREKKNFADYYLPYANSYMLYEVVKETGPFCIMAFKSQGKVCYRFIDAPYDRTLFMDEAGNVHESFDKIRATLDKRNIDYSRKIDRYEEYRDILYGNNEGKRDLAKYAFLESRQYQNIPRTIQNVFLNSKLEAEFIKETIIHSLNDDDIEIKLDTYQYQLKDFEEQLKDIRQFGQPATQKQANQIADLYLLIRRNERHNEELVVELESSYRQALLLQPTLSKNVESLTENKGGLLAKLDDTKKRHENKKDKLLAEISVLDDRLRSAKDKKAYYEKLNIEQVVERVAKKGEIERKAHNLREEKTLLSIQYKETTQKYEAILKQLENQFAEETNRQKQHQLLLDANLLTQKEEIRKQYAAVTDAIKKQHQQKLADAQLQVEDAGNRVTLAEVKKAELKHSQWYSDEIKQAKEVIDDLTNNSKAAEHNIAALNTTIASLQKQWDVEEQARQDKKDREKEKHDDAASAIQQQVAAINKKLDSTKGSLYEWLNKNKTGWNANIGKVINEEVLFMSDLAPQQVEKSSLFYGISINLKEIEKTAKSAEDYEIEKKQLNGQLNRLQEGWQKWQEGWDSETEKLRKKITVQLREKRDEAKELNYNLQQFQQKLQQAKLTLTDLSAKAQTDKQQALYNAQLLVDEALGEKKLAREQAKKIEDEVEKQVRSKEKEREQKILEAVEENGRAKAIAEQELEQSRTDHNSRVANVKQQQQNELRAGGADTERLSEIEQQLTLLESELKFIDRNRDTIAEYKKDKRELLDKTDSFKNTKQNLQQQLTTEEAKYATQQRAFNSQVAEINDAIADLNKQLELLREDINEYQGIIQLDWFKASSATLVKAAATLRRCKDLVQLIKEIYYSIIEKVDAVKEVINKFLSHFSSNNIFKFSSILIDKKEYLEFAEKLQQFIEDNRIAEFEKRVNERYASIIKLIGKETNELTSSEGEIQRIISRINNDFTQNNAIAVGVIQKIEMKMDESDNKVVQVLKLIQQFNSESGFELGAANLFTQHDSDSKNKKAVDLLKQLIKEIQNLRRDTITLSDSFEIKFRIIENKNDTGWVERLANVGSEGTDVLVKAMINIMLLNVFKEGASKRFKDFKLHCMMDEIGRLHPVNVRGILNFASARNIWLINGSPTENDALAYRHIYKLEKDSKSVTRVKRILSQHSFA